MSDNIEKDVDFGPYDKDETEEKEEDEPEDDDDDDEKTIFKESKSTKEEDNDDNEKTILKAEVNALKGELAIKDEIERKRLIEIETMMAHTTVGSPYVLRSATSLAAASIASPEATAVATPTFTPPTGVVAMKHQKTLDIAIDNIDETIEYIKTKHFGKHTELFLICRFVNQYKDATPHDPVEHKSFSRFLANANADIEQIKATRCTPQSTVAGSP